LFPLRINDAPPTLAGCRRSRGPARVARYEGRQPSSSSSAMMPPLRCAARHEAALRPLAIAGAGLAAGHAVGVVTSDPASPSRRGAGREKGSFIGVSSTPIFRRSGPALIELDQYRGASSAARREGLSGAIGFPLVLLMFSS
jgi:hypothetical protein